MAGEDFLLRVAIDAANVPASLLAIANSLAGLKGESAQLDVAINKLERDLVKMSAAAGGAATAAGSAATAAGAAGKAAATAGDGVQKLGQNLATTRYAMFSSAQTLTTLGGVLLLVSTLPAIVSAKFQSEFAQVERTVQGAGNSVKQALIDMSTQIPITFKSLASIAALGGQLGIGVSGILDFTKTVAILSTTTNLTAEAAGTMLGRFKALLGIPDSQFKNIASAILNLGVNTAATETQIVAIATGIASVAHEAGFSAGQIIGLSGALASLGDQPYLSRGVITRALTELVAAVSSGGPKLQAFADIAGLSMARVSKDFGTVKFAGDFTQFTEALGKIDIASGGVAQALARVGITGSLALKLFQTLAQSGTVLRDSQNLQAEGWNNVSILTSQFNHIADTTKSKFIELTNSFAAFFNAIGSGQQAPLTSLLSGLKDLVVGFTAFASTNAGQTMIAVASGAGVLLGVMALLGAVWAKTIGGVIGLTSALAGFNAREAESIGLTAALRTELELTGVAGKVASAGIGLFTKALALVLPAIAVFAAFQWAGELVKGADAALKASISVDKLKGSTVSATKELEKFLNSAGLNGLGGQPATPSAPFSRTPGLAQKNSGPEDPVATLAKQVNNRQGPVANFIDGISGGIAGRASGQTQALESLGKLDSALAKLVSSGNGAKAADIFSELQKRAKAGGADVADFTSQFTKFPAALKAAEAGISKVNSGLATQKDIVQTLQVLTNATAKEQDAFASAYAKSVAPLTGFNNVVGQVQAGLSDMAASMAEKSSKSPKSFYDGISVSLQQFTDQLTVNNGKQSEWAANLITLNAQTAGSAQNAAATFIAAGYTAVNASLLQQLVNATPAQRDAYIKAQQDAANLSAKATAQAILASGYIVTDTGFTVGAATAKNLAGILATGIGLPEALKVLNLKLQANPLTPVVGAPNTTPADIALQSFINRWQGSTIKLTATGSAKLGSGILGNAAGGRISGPGTGTSDSIPSMLSNGEYVIKASSVSKYGNGLFDQLNRGVARFASGGPVGAAPSTTPTPGLSVVALSAQDKAILNWIGNQLSLSIDGKDIAAASGAANLVKVEQRQTA